VAAQLQIRPLRKRTLVNGFADNSVPVALGFEVEYATSPEEATCVGGSGRPIDSAPRTLQSSIYHDLKVSKDSHRKIRGPVVRALLQDDIA
jgi:hypothetical protein